jgi:hypothetical protein
MTHDDRRERDDFGQADYSRDYAYDPSNRTGYRADEPPRVQADDSADLAYDPETGRTRPSDVTAPAGPEAPRPRSWMDRAGEFLGARPRPEVRHFETDRDAPRLGRNGPSDRVLWAVIMERLDDERRLDLRDVRVEVIDAEVILSGTVRHRDDKRRIEDVVDVDGVRNVQNNLRPRDKDSRWTFL